MLFFSKIKTLSILAICLLAILFSIVNFVPENSKINNLLPNQKVSLGLDLRGGSHLLLQIDFDFYLKEKLENLKNDIKSEFRKEKVRVIPSKIDNRIIFRTSNKNTLKKATRIVRKLDKDIQIDENKGKVEISFSTNQIVKMRRNLMAQSIEIVRRRIDETGTKEPIIQAQGSDRILLQVPGLDNPAQIKNLLGQTAKMTFHFVEQNSSIKTIRMQDRDGQSYNINKKVILSGDLLIDANATYYEGQPAVSFRFNTVGTRKFASITKDNIGRIFAIVLDGKVVTAPRINTIINQGSGVISGSFTVNEANDVALLLRAGALPAPLKIIEERTVGPSLGLDSIKAGTWAAIMGLILVALAMLIIYKFFGLIANIALIINVALILSALSLINATLTLPGIAGIVLTIGMAVDANVLIFERIKEELKNNRNLIVAIDSGFSQAFRTIIDSNITTLIAAILLYIFGNGPIRGFGVTLSFGILASMFSAIMFTRMVIALWIKKYKPTSLSI